MSNQRQDAINRFLALEARKAEAKKIYEDLDAATEELVKVIGVGSYFQASDGTVFKTVVPEGTFVHFKKYDHVRTKREGERAGTLSVKEAEAAGFTVK